MMREMGAEQLEPTRIEVDNDGALALSRRPQIVQPLASHRSTLLQSAASYKRAARSKSSGIPTA